MKKIFVTKPFLPPLKQYLPYLEQIWESGIVANGGRYHKEFQERLADYLGVKYVCLFANGTLALVTALQSLRITGEVITTPFSFVATAHSLLWNGIKPVFVDTGKNSFNIDPELIESAITPQTTAIMPVHVYGIPCNVAEIEKIADNYNLKVIYDAAHAFGVRIPTGEGGQGSILNFGDLSVLSFHATKVFNTFEGGAIICHDQKTKDRIDKLKNFGHNGETSVVSLGINGKMNEIQSAFGLCEMDYLDGIFSSRMKADEKYRELLQGVGGIILSQVPADIQYNYSYFPVLVTGDYPLTRDELNDTLRWNDIYPRRYFYPLISTFPMYKNMAGANNVPNAQKISEQVLCLPLYPELEISDIEMICDIIKKPVKS